MPVAPPMSPLNSTDLFHLGAGVWFLATGLLAMAMAVVRREAGAKLFLWLGLWSAFFGGSEMLQVAGIANSLPELLRPIAARGVVIASYLLLVVGTRAYLELALGRLRPILKILLALDLIVAALGIGWYLATGVANRFLGLNNALAAITLVILVSVVAVPRLSMRYLVVARHRVLTVGTLVFALQALYANMANVLRLPDSGVFGSVGFAVLLLSFAYTGVEMVSANERRLLSIEKELQIARELQFSILPERAPQMANLRIAALYAPMTAVGGDFYEFVPIDEARMGFLVADVSGHGVPAALIASMIKVAAHSLDGHAHEASAVMRHLEGVLASGLRGQFVSAAYVCLDSSKRVAQYSAAGHPPLLVWRASQKRLERIESNGLLFGVLRGAEYPQCAISLEQGDRLLLYTDGITDPENGTGEAFGDAKLEESMRRNWQLPAAELSAKLMEDARSWAGRETEQQDDMTLIVVDLL